MNQKKFPLPFKRNRINVPVTILLSGLLLSCTCCMAQRKDGGDLLLSNAGYRIAIDRDTGLYSFIQMIDTGMSVNYIKNVADILSNKDQLLRSNSRCQYFQLAGTLFSFIGDYKRAITDFDSCEYNSHLNYIDSTADVQPFVKDITFKDASKVILDSAATHSIVMLNEAHHHGRHRVFTYTLLKDLYQLGYRYFGLETLSPYGFNEKEPVSTKSGFYTIEPNMAELVRYAKELGYKVFAYESTKDEVQERDSIQALNIKSVVGGLMNGKLLIHAGYGHIAERSFGVPVMGEQLKKLLKTDPFTVDQVDFSEGRRNSVTQALYYLIARNSNATTGAPLALFNNDKPYQLTRRPLYDLLVYTPPAVYNNGRPDWLAANGMRKKTSIEVPKAFRDKTVLVQAYFNNDISRIPIHQCIPLDQSYFINNNRVDLYLRKGAYVIVFRDLYNNILAKNIFVCK